MIVVVVPLRNIGEKERTYNDIVPQRSFVGLMYGDESRKSCPRVKYIDGNHKQIFGI